MPELFGLCQLDGFSDTWRVTEVAYPSVIWERYARAITLPVLHETFGDNWPPKSKRPGEHVFVFRDFTKYQRPFDPTDHPAAWLSLTQDQFDDRNWYMSRGVWPDYHKRSLGRFIRAWAEYYVRQLGGDSLTIWVHADNVQHLEHVANDDYWELMAVAKEPLSFMYTHEI